MRRPLLCLLALLLATSPAGAQTKTKFSAKNLPTPEAAVETCRNKAKTLYASGEPEKLKRGDELRIQCLEAAILAQARQIFEKPNEAEKTWRGYLKEMRAGQEGIWGELLTQTSHCLEVKTCGGGKWRIGDRHALLLEEILSDILSDRKSEDY